MRERFPAHGDPIHPAARLAELAAHRREAYRPDPVGLRDGPATAEALAAASATSRPR